MELAGARNGAGPSCWTEAMHKNRSLPFHWSSDLLRKWSVRGVNVAIYMYIYVAIHHCSREESIKIQVVHAQSTYCTGNYLFSEILIIQRNAIYKIQAFESHNISILVCALNMSLVIKFSRKMTIAQTDNTTQVVVASSVERYSESTADPF